MKPAKTAWVDESVLSPRNRVQIVQAAHVKSPPWVRGFPVCPTLNQYHIVNLGITEACHPTRMVRTRQSTAFFLACIGGQGLVLIDGSWRICPEGYACLLPAHTLNAFKTLPGQRWNYCHVCYQIPAQQRPMGDTNTPVMARFDARLLRSAIQGLVVESSGTAQPALLQDWTNLVHAYVQRFVKALDQPDQLRLLWKRVESSLAEDWSLERLVQESGYSTTHLHRLCLRQLGRSPMRQVIYLRMRRAAELLSATGQTIEAVAHEVGYKNPFVFSNTFTKWIGWRPSECRLKNSKV